MKVFLDTNVLISAFATRGLCADLFRLLIAEHDVQTGEVNLLELRRVLIERFKATPDQVDLAEQLLRDHTVIPKPPDILSVWVRDPDDAWVLPSAVRGEADMLVIGDQDLLSIAGAAPIAVVTPRDAWTQLRRS